MKDFKAIAANIRATVRAESGVQQYIINRAAIKAGMKITFVEAAFNNLTEPYTTRLTDAVISSITSKLSSYNPQVSTSGWYVDGYGEVTGAVKLIIVIPN